MRGAEVPIYLATQGAGRVRVDGSDGISEEDEMGGTSKVDISVMSR